MKMNLSNETKKSLKLPAVDPELTLIVEALDTKTFWGLIRKYAALTLVDSTNDFPGEPVISGADFLADLQTEIQHAAETIRELQSEERGSA